MRAPAAPKVFATSISSIARLASTVSWQMSTPLPRARPSALTTQRPASSPAKRLASAASENVFERAVGMWCRSMKSCENAFEASNCAARWLGPQMRRPFDLNKSTMPSASGLSGPTTTRSGFCSCANASSFGRSSALILTHSTGAPFLARRSWAMPALPGAHHICVAWGDCASFQTSACSRPPEPITSSFMKARIQTRWPRQRSKIRVG